ncbi:MAG: hypothetical protein K2M78_08170 [Lachnospiraceae bacterium]|nr:hypothetical protein [Lachnospiraceae bacterium]
MKNFKYFLTLGIILVSGATVLTGCGVKDSKEETTTINIFGSSPEKTDEKNADEIAAQINNCICDYQSETYNYDTNSYNFLIPAGGDDIIIEWTSENVTENSIKNKRFKELIEKCFAGESLESKVKKGSFPKVTISLKDTNDPKQGYKITVELGEATVNHYRQP